MTNANEILAAAEESPRLVGLHDKAGWLGLFAEQATLEDPVGAAAHRRDGSGPDPLDPFYEIFIAPNRIRFEVNLDVVAGREVARDVVIHTELANGTRIQVAAYLLYDIVEEAGRLRIGRMAAHWELPRMSWQVMSKGLGGLAAMNGITLRMLRLWGLGGVVGYMRGMVQGIFGEGRRLVERFAAIVGSDDRDLGAAHGLFVESDATVEWPVGAGPLSVAQFFARLPAGIKLRIERPLSSGWVTAFRFLISGDGQARPGIGFFLFDPGSRRIAQARFFVADAA